MNDDLIVVIRIDKDTRKPSYEFKGEWAGRWAKLAIAKMPKAYRQHMAKKLKLLELEKKVNETIEGKTEETIEETIEGKTEETIESEGVNNDTRTDNGTSEPGRAIRVRREGQQVKRGRAVKKRNGRPKKGKRTDTKGKTGSKNKPVVPEATAGTGETAKGSAADEPEPSAWTAAYERPDGTNDRT